MLEARNVTVKRGTKRLVDSASLSIVPGRLTAVIGPNGAGKSTLAARHRGRTDADRGPCVSR